MVQKVNFNNLTGDTLTVGNTVITGTGVTVGGEALGGSITTYANASVLPLSGLTAGEFAYVSSNSSIYFTNGSGWYLVQSVNQSPSVTLSATTLEVGGTNPNTATFTYTVTEPEGTPYTLTVSNSGIANTSVGNVQHYTSNNTIIFNGITMSESDNFQITVSASDGVNIGTATASIAYAASQYFYLDTPDGGEEGNTSILDRTSSLGSDVATSSYGMTGGAFNISSDSTYLRYRVKVPSGGGVEIDNLAGTGNYKFVWCIRVPQIDDTGIGMVHADTNGEEFAMATFNPGGGPTNKTVAFRNGSTSSRNMSPTIANDKYYIMMVKRHGSSELETQILGDYLRAKVVGSGSPYDIDCLGSAGGYAPPRTNINTGTYSGDLVFFGGDGGSPVQVAGSVGRATMEQHIRAVAIYPVSMTDDEIIADFENAIT
jgi:hypothetical protein